MDRYRGMDRAELDVAYNNRAVVPGWQDYLDRWRRNGHATYAHADARDLRYGSGDRHRMDLFMPKDGKSPVCLFLHGGYWQWNDKEGQAFVADGILKIGLGAAIGEYTLAPAASMSEICREAEMQVEFLSEELKRRNHDGQIVVCGISTGAHLLACTLHLDYVVGAVFMSGIYDLEPIRLSSLNEAIQMSWEEARQHSPLHQVPDSMPSVVLAFGTHERPEIQRQSTDYGSALCANGHHAVLLPVEGADHFSILETLSDGEGEVAKALRALAMTPGSRTWRIPA
jgi:arylformamidase